MTTPPDVPAAPPTFDATKAVVGAFLASVLETEKLKDEFKALLTEVLHNAFADALVQLGAPGDPLTAWLNGWFTQIRTDYTKGGVLYNTIMDASHNVNVHMLLPNPEGEHE